MTSRPRRGDDDGSDVITSAPRDLLALGAAADLENVVVSGLDESIASVRRRTARLAYLIICRDYLQAWCEACDLHRAICEADRLVLAEPELQESSDGGRRLDAARGEAEAVLELAPDPSSEATRRAFAPAPHTDQTRWDREVAQWITKLAALKRPTIATADFRQSNAAGERTALRARPRRNVAGER